MKTISKDMLYRVYQQNEELSIIMSNITALSVIAAGSDYDNHTLEMTQSYWGILLDYINQAVALSERLLDELTRLLNL